MRSIELLDKTTIDKIAAGEVVERPASVVKELTENAIDASATAITIEIRDGGTTMMRITDNGAGIPADQVRKAFLRHATSKIRKVEDLVQIASLGFRGEALSSISAVSRMECITKTPEALTGIRYVIEGGEEKEYEEIGAPTGTTFIVRNLFYNTPARAKFLKSAQSEASQVTSFVEELALSHPDISFKFIVNGQNRLYTSGNGNLKEIVYQIFGRDITKELIPIESDAGALQINGFIGNPTIARGSRGFENYFVNGRYVKNKIIAKAIEDGYHGFLMQHKFPFTLLYLTIDGDKVDVNVHPSKLEVRFSDQEMIYRQLCLAIQNALIRKERIPAVSMDRDKRAGGDAAKLPVINESRPEPFEAVRRTEEAQIEQTDQPGAFAPGPGGAIHSSNGNAVKPYSSYTGNANAAGGSSYAGRPGGYGGNAYADAGRGTFRIEEGPASYGQNAGRQEETNFLDAWNREMIASGKAAGNVGSPDAAKNMANDAAKNVANEAAVSNPTDPAKDRTSANAELTAEVSVSEGTASTEVNSSTEVSSSIETNSAAEVSTIQENISVSDGSAKAEQAEQLKQPEQPEQLEKLEKPEQLNLFDEDKVLSEQARKMYRLIGQLFDTYWLIEYRDSLYIIDQHAAHEKVNYEKMMKAYREKTVTSQMIYPPILVSLSAREAALLDRHMDAFEQLGFEIEDFGGNAYRICAVPANLYSIASDRLFTEILDQLDELGEIRPDAVPERLASMSCKAAVKGNSKISAAEMEALIDELLTLENPYNCPHGRPTIISMSRYELDRKFKRIV